MDVFNIYDSNRCKNSTVNVFRINSPNTNNIIYIIKKRKRFYKLGKTMYNNIYGFIY